MSKLIYTGKELSQHNPELVDEWDYDKNYPVTPDDVSYGSAEKYWWKCKKCGKSYEASPNQRTCKKTACPYCAAKDRGLSQKATYAERNNLAKKYPELLKDWDYDKNTKNPTSTHVGQMRRFGGNVISAVMNGKPHRTEGREKTEQVALYAHINRLPRRTRSMRLKQIVLLKITRI